MASDYKVMAANSIMFFESSKLLKRVFEVAENANNKELMAYYFVPYIVNNSFAIEMAIKAILTKEGATFKKIHKIGTVK